MNFKLWLESIHFTRWLSNGEISVIISGKEYRYRTDPGFFPKLKQIAKRKPFTALNLIKKLIDNGQAERIDESMRITAVPELDQHSDEAQRALTDYLQRYGNDNELKSNQARFKYTLINYKLDTWANEASFSFEYDVIEQKKGEKEVLSPDHPLYKLYSGGMSGKKLYKSPKDAIESIEENPNLAYRGMSWEEWRQVQKTGLIQSIGEHNFSTQKTLTFFGMTPDTGESYAGNFAPIAYASTPTRPGIIIAIPRNMLKSNKDNPNIPKSELAIEGSLPASNITSVWMLVTTSAKPGKLTITMNLKTNKVRMDSGIAPRLGYSIRKLK